MESMQKILENKEGLAACYELVEKILADKIKDQNQLEKEKILISRKYKLEKLLKNADIIAYCEMHRKKDLFEMKKFLMTKPVRTMSGVANIAVMWLGENNYSCPFNCIYCPQGEQVDSDGSKVSAPKSYIGVEPTTLRAMRNKYDPYKQVSNRLKQFRIIGHTTDKCELIIMGGTFLAWGQKNYENFIKRCYDAFNEKESVSLEDAKKTNEQAG
jgi:elongator complex protein 3